MKNLIVILILFLYTLKGICQGFNIVGRDDTTNVSFNEELNKFIKKTNQSDMNLYKYNVYVIHVFLDYTRRNCIGYSVGYIINYHDYDRVEPQYYYTDSSNIIIINFDTSINKKIIPGLKITKIEKQDKKKIINKLVPMDYFLHGPENYFIFYECGNKKWIKNYQNLIDIPKGKSIYRHFSMDDFEIKVIDENSF